MSSGPPYSIVPDLLLCHAWEREKWHFVSLSHPNPPTSASRMTLFPKHSRKSCTVRRTRKSRSAAGSSPTPSSWKLTVPKISGRKFSVSRRTKPKIGLRAGKEEEVFHLCTEVVAHGSLKRVAVIWSWTGRGEWQQLPEPQRQSSTEM